MILNSSGQGPSIPSIFHITVTLYLQPSCFGYLGRICNKHISNTHTRMHAHAKKKKNKNFLEEDMNACDSCFSGVTGLVMPSAAEIEVKVLKHLWTPERAQRSMHRTKRHSSIIPVLSPTQVLPSSGKKVSKLGK